MHFQITRDGQTYGPYTLEDLQRYVASGNILPTDMAKSDDMPVPRPVSEILGGQAAGAVPASEPTPAPFAANPGFQTSAQPSAYMPPVYPQPAYPQAVAVSPYPDPPSLHWGLYLLFTVITCSLFSKIFTIVQAAWLKRVQPNSTGIFFYAALYVLWIGSLILGVGRYSASILRGNLYGEHVHRNYAFTAIYFCLLFATRLVMSRSIEEHFNGPEPLGMSVNPVLAFCFGGVYFQAKFKEAIERKRAAMGGYHRGF